VYSTVNRPNDVALVYLHITHSIKTHADMSPKRIRGARWQGLGRVFAVSSVKQFRL